MGFSHHGVHLSSRRRGCDRTRCSCASRLMQCVRLNEWASSLQIWRSSSVGSPERSRTLKASHIRRVRSLKIWFGNNPKISEDMESAGLLGIFSSKYVALPECRTYPVWMLRDLREGSLASHATTTPSPEAREGCHLPPKARTHRAWEGMRRASDHSA